MPFAAIDTRRGLVAVGQRRQLSLHRIDTLGRQPGLIFARIPEKLGDISMPAFDPSADRLALSAFRGPTSLWRLDGDGSQPEGILESPADKTMSFSPDGSLLAQAADSDGPDVVLWEMNGAAGVAPLGFDSGRWAAMHVAFDPDSRWLATAGSGFNLALWPLTGKYCRVLQGHEGEVASAVFAPDGSRYFTLGQADGTVRSWSLDGGNWQTSKVLFRSEPGSVLGGLGVDPDGRFLISASTAGTVKIPLDGSPATVLEGFPRFRPRLSPDGRLVAAPRYVDGPTSTVVVHDLESDQRWAFEPPGEGNLSSWYFDGASRLLPVRGGVLSRWDPASETTEILVEAGVHTVRPVPDGRLLVRGEITATGLNAVITTSTSAQSQWWIFNPEDGSRTDLELPDEAAPDSFDPSMSTMFTVSSNGSIGVWPMAGGKAHFLLGHQGEVYDARLSPDGHWIASFGGDGTVRLWPMPDLSKPSIHTLQTDELVAKLKSLTNLRAVPSDESYTGYTIEPDFTAYRGWAEVPEW
jgi:WD40 repeat protein